ncbi:MAG: hypothetical protein VKL39_13745 [Leptolyngbyaceae bacterium]|nr:hypothetical protein [Leptolyngbyaceae bacterium]
MSDFPKPMLSADLAKVDNDFRQLRYPLLASPKLDGIRCTVWGGVAYSRNGEPLRNQYFQQWVKQHAQALEAVDGEVVVGSPTDPLCLNNTQSGIMAFAGRPPFVMFGFDVVAPELSFMERLELLARKTYKIPEFFEEVEHQRLISPEQVLKFESEALAQGYEGIMTRDPDALYKHGRSTLKEQGLVKVKRFIDGEAVVVRVEEGSHNVNEATSDALGRTKRSRVSAGLQANGMVGTILAHSAEWGELRIAPGKMSHADRLRYWQKPELLVGKTVHWRCFGYGVKDKPRFPRFYGIRSGE